ncbi:MAG: pilus assembly FimT family protein [Pyrinomonadaceae bacterium]
MNIRKKDKKNQKGFSLPELIVVLLVIAILVVLALPQVISSRRLFRFAGLQRQVASSLVDARQEAMTQRTPITFRYDNQKKDIIIYGGSFGAIGDSKNRKVELTDSGLEQSDVVYNRPSGAPTSALSDTSNITPLTAGKIDITFQSDGSVIDAANNPVNNALFFYHKKYTTDTAFAISILGAGGRVKTWRYSKGVKAYVE